MDLSQPPHPCESALRPDAARALDALLHAAAAQSTRGLSPVALALAGTDWALHLATQPATSSRLAAQAVAAAMQAWRPGDDDPSAPPDPRFAHPAWTRWPLAPLARLHRAAQGWWDLAAQRRGMSRHHQALVRFHARQWLDLLSPSNWPLLNPEVREHTRERAGLNLVAGWQRLHDDWRAAHGLAPLRAQPERGFVPGRDVAVTPGRVVWRSHLAELIQYLPLTASVQAEPVVIVPSWIMKYYILDLSSHNSLVRWLVSQGHTVFILSWRNPDAGDAQFGMDDYLEAGLLDALAAVARQVPDEAVHLCGYCLGGTLAAIAAAALARPQGVAQLPQLPALASLTLLATETDFSEPGEMGVMIDDAQIALLEDLMAEQGFLDGAQMAGAFTWLHARELVWSRAMRRLWLDGDDTPSDLLAWNADATRMPARMHAEYLRRCYLRNELAEGRYPVQGAPVSLRDLRLPLFVVGTETDHVAPWRSVYRIHALCDADIRFVLTSGGHNAGIVSEPGHPGRRFASRRRAPGAAWEDPAQWQDRAERQEGSWWPAWHDWLVQRGSGHHAKARTPTGTDILGDAPGTYVHQRCDGN